MKIYREQLLEALGIPVNGADGAIVTLPDFVEITSEEIDRLNVRVNNFETVIKDFLEWGPMTGSDRDMFHSMFKAALAGSEPKGKESA